ncbi:MAG TPA: hypothetical protein VGB38_06590 [bacterium]
MKIRTTLLFWILQPFLVFSAMPVPGDSSKTASPQHDSPRQGSGNEILLEEIDIHGVLEQPSVIIVPKRIEPDLEQMELSRSFDQEVKENVGDMPKQDEPLRKVEPVPSIKKTIEKKRD